MYAANTVFSIGRVASILASCVFCLNLSLATSVNADQIALGWNDNSTDETGFRIERAVEAGGFVQIGTVGENIVTFRDSDVVDGVRYRYRVCAFNAAGDSAYSNIVSNAPVFTVQPSVPPAVAPGGSATLTATASGGGPLRYQWQVSTDGGTRWTNLVDSETYAGTSSPRLTISSASPLLAGNHYRAVVNNSVGSAASNVVVLRIGTTSRLSNFAVRSLVGSNAETLIVGFVVARTGPKPMLVRGIGPTLRSFGIGNPLAFPLLTLYSGSRALAENDSWSAGPAGAAIAAQAAALGAFPLPVGSADAALLASAETGPATVQLGGRANSTGIGLVEVYDADLRADARVINVSARTQLTSANTPIIGFVVAGELPKQILIRAIGPSLTAFGVSGVLGDPEVVLAAQGSTSTLQQNDNWGGRTELKQAFAATGAFPLADGTRDAVLLASVAAGAYTARITGVNGSTGTVLLEVYDLDP